LVKVAKLFKDRFDSIEDTDDGVSLCCNECDAAFKIPSPIDAISEGEMELDYSDQIIELIERVLEHLDECQPTDERQH
jgi:hypothetical protein